MKRLMIAAAVLAALTGCAFTTDRIELAYTKQEAVAKIPGADAIAVNVQVNDQRQDKGKVSSKKNGFGAETAPILAVEDVALTVKRAIEQELQSRGFQLGPQEAFVRLKADIVRFYNDHKTGFFAGDAIAELNLNVSVITKDGNSVYARNIAAQGMESNIQLMSGENAKLALERALSNGMKILFEDQDFISTLMSK